MKFVAQKGNKYTHVLLRWCALLVIIITIFLVIRHL